MIARFALSLVCGMSLMWCFMRRDQVTSGFFRIQMLVALGLSVLAAVAFGSHGALTSIFSRFGSNVCWTLAAITFVGSMLWRLELRRAGAVAGALVAVGSSALLMTAAVISSHFPKTSDLWPLPYWLAPVSALAGAALLGGALVGMLLGHWYLTAPTMSIAPLSHLNALFGAAAVARLVSATVGLVFVLAGDGLSGGTHWTWLTLRWSAGIVGPIVVALMVWRILRYRNTQAATGVLFVGVILTFIGELSATLLSREVGIAM